MSWVDKAHKKDKIHKLIQQAMNSKEYQDARRKDMEQATLQVLCRFCFLICEYMEMKHRYKKNGLTDLLNFVKTRTEEIGEDEQYFTDVENYYKEQYDLDVLSVLGLFLEREGD